MNKRAEQNRHIEQWRASGLSQSEYSRRHGLKMATFNYWVRRMEAEGAHPVSQLSTSFLPVQIEEMAQAALPTVQVRVVKTARGYVLELSPSVSPRWLAELLQCLG